MFATVRNHRRGAWGCVLASTSLLAVSAPGLEAEPSALTFRTQDQGIRVVLREGDAAVPGSALQSWRLLVEDHTYNHMLSVERKPGALHVLPTDRLEMGTYALELRTTRGTVRLPVSAPLDAMPTSLESQAAQLGITVEELKMRKGLFTQSGRPEGILSLASAYTVGQSVPLPVETPGQREQGLVITIDFPGVLYTNASGENMHYFDIPGSYDIQATLLRESDGAIVSHDVQTVVIEEEAAVIRTVPVRTRLRFGGPNGFRRYQWKLDGEAMGSDQAFAQTFREPGSYRVQMVASEPTADAPNMAMRRITYDVTVEPRS